MPKLPSVLDNKGIGFLPLLVFGSILSVLTLVGYNQYQSGNLNVLQSSTSSNVQIQLDSRVNQRGSGTLFLNVTSSNPNTQLFIDTVKKSGLGSEYLYCYTLQDADSAKCTKAVNARVIDKGLPNGVFYRIQFPVNWRTSEIWIGKTDRLDVKFDITVNKDPNLWNMWQVGVQSNGFPILKKLESGILGLSIKRLNQSRNQELLEFTYTGNNEILSQIHVNITNPKVNPGSFTSAIESGMKNNLKVMRTRYSNGKLVVNVQVPSNVSIFRFGSYSIDGKIVETGTTAIPNGWILNKDLGANILARNTTLVQPTPNTGLTVDINQVSIRGSTDVNLNFIVRGETKNVTTMSDALKKGIKYNICDAPNDVNQNCIRTVSPNIVCGNTLTAGCRFSLRVPDNTRKIIMSDYYQLVSSLGGELKINVPNAWCSAYVGGDIENRKYNNCRSSVPTGGR